MGDRKWEVGPNHCWMWYVGLKKYLIYGIAGRCTFKHGGRWKVGRKTGGSWDVEAPVTPPPPHSNR